MAVLPTDPLSTRAFFLELWFGKDKIAVATGCSWETDEGRSLITNAHVLSGKHPETDQPLSPHGSVPDRVGLYLPIVEEDDGRSFIRRWSAESLELYDNQQRPRWLEHPTFGRQLDVAALRLPAELNARCPPINTVRFEEFEVAVGQDVFILGFPKGISGPGRLPIWKRGSIASEPAFSLDGLPKLLVDSATRTGMSGSPVITQHTGVWNPNGVVSGNSWIGQGRAFLGLYSGRISGDDELDAQLGIVWKASAIEEVAAGIPGSN